MPKLRERPVFQNGLVAFKCLVVRKAKQPTDREEERSTDQPGATSSFTGAVGREHTTQKDKDSSAR